VTVPGSETYADAMAGPARRSGWSFSVEFRGPKFRDLLGMAYVALIALKLAGVIGWSWWLVLLPLLIQLSVLFVVGLLFVYLGLTKLAEWWHWRRIERRPDW
jgi:hypothetical protein